MTAETRTAETKPAAELRGIAKLKAFKERAITAGMITFTLPDSGVEVTVPAFKSNGVWMKANAMAEGDNRAAILVYIQMLCLFDGERLTVSDYQDLISQPDHTAIVNKIFESEADRNKTAGAEKK